MASRIVYSAAFFTLAMLLIITNKPSPMFDGRTGAPRPFGLGEDKTLFSLGAVTVALAVMSYYVFALIDACLN